MTNIFNTNNLYWVYTKYAKDRIVSFNQSSDGETSNIKLYKIKIGDYDWYTDERGLLGEGGYSESAFKEYFQNGDNEVNNLGNFITYTSDEDDENTPMEFVITSKETNDDNTCVVLTTTIGEDVGGFDIREIGIYEVVSSTEEKLFAVCTMQPLPKPSKDTKHLISTELKCHLYSPKLVELFQYIEIDPNNNYATLEDVQNYQMNLLFVESNLSEQISRNAQIIGYDRVQQLYELIKDNQELYAKLGMSSVYSNIANMLEVKNFWTFNNTGSLTRDAVFDDVSLNNENLGADQLSSQYTRGFEGIASWVNFDNSHYYTLKAPACIEKRVENNETSFYIKNGKLINTEVDGEGNITKTYDVTFVDVKTDKDDKVISVSDSPFTIVFLGAQNSNSEECSIINKYNASTERPGFSITVTKNREVKVALYTNKNNYVVFKTPSNSVPVAGKFYSLIVSYNGNVEQPEVYVNIDDVNYSTSFEQSDNTIYKGMSLDGMLLPLFSFERTYDEDTRKTINSKYINSKVCLLSIIKGNFSEEYRQAISYSLMSLTGHNPCLM